MREVAGEGFGSSKMAARGAEGGEDRASLGTWAAPHGSPLRCPRRG